tara:strand:- start:5250 stop:6272 length:1023 start_codon:yes stop_codon:yes gene_type:complete
MALFKEKYEAKKFTTISSSDDYSASRVFKGKQRLPFSLQRGAQSAWFDSSKIEEDKIVKLEGKYFYAPIKKSNFASMMDTYLSSNISPQAYTQISASLTNKMSSMGDDELITIMAEDGAPPTASYSPSPRTGISPYTTTITDTSTLSTGATWSFAGGNGEYYQNEFTSSHQVHFILSASVSSSTVTGSNISNERGKINTASYSNLFDGAGSGLGMSLLKMKALGDGEITDTDKFFFAETKEFLIFPHGLSGSVGSSSLKHATLAQNVVGSSLITVYHSGSSPNFGLENVQSGSHLFLSEDLRVTASHGWYAADGSSTVYQVPDVSDLYAAKRFNGNSGSV